VAAPVIVVSHAHIGGTGAVSTDGRIQEEVFSARVCAALAPLLVDAGCTVYEIALPNVRVADGKRMTKTVAIDKLDPVLAIEPHVNALRKPDALDEDHDGDYQDLIDDRRGNGLMVLYAAGSVRGMHLATNVGHGVSRRLPEWSGKKGDPFRNRGAMECPGPAVHRSRVAFLQDTRCVAALPELLFLTNPDELEWLCRPEAPGLLAAGIAEGVTSSLRSWMMLP
jgi:hypothetical protein